MKAKLAVQMFTLREHTKTAADLARTLEKVAKIGYPAVQLSAVGCMNGEEPEVTAADARKILDDNGLKCVATHRGWDALAGDTEKEIAFHQALGCDFAAIGGIPKPGYGDEGFEGYQQFARDAAPTIAKLKAAGIRWGYHNHAYEFKRVKGGKTWYSALIDEGGPDFCLEVDTYWCMHAGFDPVRLFADPDLKGRFPVIHVKDKDVNGNDSIMAPIGEGNLDWGRILTACEAAGVEWYAVEQDQCYGRDAFDCLKSSFDFLAAC